MGKAHTEDMARLDNWRTGGQCKCGVSLPCNRCVEPPSARSRWPEGYGAAKKRKPSELLAVPREFKTEVHKKCDAYVKRFRAQELKKCRLNGIGYAQKMKTSSESENLGSTPGEPVPSDCQS